MPENHRRKQVAIIGSGDAAGSDGSDARELGRLIAQRRWILITGGRDAGVMAAANEGAKEVEGSLTTGILPNTAAKVSRAVDVPIITDMGEARNNVIVLSADIVIACGARDAGTVSEVALALKAKKNVILLGVGPTTMNVFANVGRRLVHTAATPQQACEVAERLFSRPF